MALASAGLEEDGIIKLVFLQEEGTGRKAVVPLVEGVDWGGFLVRVRSRLGLPAGHVVRLRDDERHTIDTIDKLLEVDESTTLQISFIAAEAAQMPAASSPVHASRRPAAAHAVAQTPRDTSSAAEECRLDIAASSSGVLGPYAEDGELKYRKRRITASRLSSLKWWATALALVGCGGVTVLHFFVSG